MTEFLVLYRGGQDAAAQMAQASPEEQQAGMQAWMEWFGRAGEAIVDGGSPVAGGDGTVGGYSILQAESAEALAPLLEGHPHLQVGTIDVLEFLPLPGM
ncbi:hypothetical protein FZI85_20125 [Mycobacterium sp. CBMA293]|uniref:hypothetical protein n=1 Tax=unclassified Mycolicibacterium TaxID=2636767 RepID=UPI0012DEA887|nr:MULTISPECIES: hypothetical protein [unclassified Mycolicibacterium]MUL48905.1 hypothetical protein [Mycolicibacterium sp. CBMA 360]MUL62516.1 hypothetical protein [Mycolicibacterium sp. CBMA 335]MUL74207.1 hypothetical protein [Mycolicibacterium sp. CBMA 311]MUL96901.1 hypothetical protein [Mycolicibacterium sp. CBMA 230]MUM13315.1 hypothetical protein [Mycolicibacterium sp. CBMA 293]